MPTRVYDACRDMVVWKSLLGDCKVGAGNMFPRFIPEAEARLLTVVTSATQLGVVKCDARAK